MYKRQHEASNCYFKKTSFQSKSGFNKNNFAKRDRDVHVKIISCHYCGKQGHVIAKCFKKQKDEENKNNKKPSFKPKGTDAHPKASDFKTIQVGRIADDRKHECIEMPVSYTHLDVYKRQSLYSTHIFIKAFFSLYLNDLPLIV